MQKTAGWIMVIVCALIILYNVAQSKYNEWQINEHPLVTLLSGGANLKPAYTFTPPFTGFEITVIAVGVIGAIMIFTAKPEK